ncbi:release factor glutamine methyltransferase [bacterium BMS3Abin01]|nr:release factor glutamine methyltransferase [bacterium BMS3Abin01]HDY69906.1 peptide chain release factor N(5)-glutamine methyltransferase [Actinomycetota bacterium]
MSLHISSLLKKSADYLKSRGSTSPRLDAELLLAEALGMRRIDLYINYDRPLNEAEVGRYRELVRARGRGEPVAYILGRAYFRDLTLRVDRNVLIPRPETEHLVEAALGRLADRDWPAPPRVLDVGTGSGAIAIAVAAGYPDTVITAVDRSAAALELARENAHAAGVACRIDFIESDMFAVLDPLATFDVILCNPPYIADDEWDGLPRDVREYEPEAALRGGADGLDFYRLLAREAPPFLRPGGRLMVEIGSAQGPGVQELMRVEAGLAAVETLKDYAGHDRVVVAGRNGNEGL